MGAEQGPNISRRDFIKGASLLSASFLLKACAPPPVERLFTPTPETKIPLTKDLAVGAIDAISSANVEVTDTNKTFHVELTGKKTWTPDLGGGNPGVFLDSATGNEYAFGYSNSSVREGDGIFPDSGLTWFMVEKGPKDQAAAPHFLLMNPNLDQITDTHTKKILTVAELKGKKNTRSIILESNKGPSGWVDIISLADSATGKTVQLQPETKFSGVVFTGVKDSVIKLDSAPAILPSSTPTPKSAQVVPTEAVAMTATASPTETATPVVDTLPTFDRFKQMILKDLSIEDHFVPIDADDVDSLKKQLLGMEAILAKRFLKAGNYSHLKQWVVKTDQIGNNGGTGEILHYGYDAAAMEWAKPDKSYIPQLGFWWADGGPFHDKAQQVLLFPAWITPPGGPSEQGRVMWYVTARDFEMNDKSPSREMSMYLRMFEQQKNWPLGYSDMSGNFDGTGYYIVVNNYFNQYAQQGLLDLPRTKQAFANLAAGKPLEQGGDPYIVYGPLTTNGHVYI